MAIDTTIALTTLATARQHLQIPAGRTENDGKIERLINAASQFCSTYCDRRFVSETYTEYFHGRKQNYVMPRQWPVTAVTSLKVSLDRDWSSPSALIDPANYEIADSDTTLVYYYYFPRGHKCIQLVSTCGYASIPYDLEHACLQIIEWWYRHNERQDIGRTSSGKGDESVGVLAELPKHILQILDAYKRVEMPSTYLPIGNL